MRTTINYSIMAVLIAASTSQPVFATNLRRNNPASPADVLNRPRINRPVTSATCASSTVVDVQYADHTKSDSYLACETVDGKTFRVRGVPEGFLKANERSIIDGTSTMDLPEGSILDESTGLIDMPPGKMLNFKERIRRNNGVGGSGGGGVIGRPGGGNSRNPFSRNLATTGQRSVLVVRVIAGDGETTASELRLSDSVFGNGVDGSADAVSLKSQYSACSYGQLNFVEADNRSGTNINIENGATTVTVSTLKAEGDTVMNSAIVDALNTQFGVTSPSELADHVMYCLPSGTMNGIAYANIGGWRSVYSDNWCTYVSGQMHEIGHNLALAHSNESGTYKDQAGMMGYSYGQDDGPLQCFNAAKSWQLGWYASHHHTFNFDDGFWSGRLIGQVDMQNINAGVDDKVLVKLNTGASTDYYAMFNRKFGTNSGTSEGGDQVLITRAGGEGNSYAESELVAKLGVNGEYTISNFDGSGIDLRFKVTALNTSGDPGYAEIEINTGCTSNSQCSDGLSCNGEETCNIGNGLCQLGTPLANCCGNEQCETDENFITCPTDCQPTCGSGGCKTLETTFQGGTGSFGNFFKIKAEKDLVITRFTVHTKDAGIGQIRVWEKAGDYINDMNDQGAWNSIMDDSNVVTQGTGSQTELASFAVPVLVLAGTYHSFYVYSSLGIRYTNGPSGEDSMFSETAGEIAFYEGRGSGNLFSGATFVPRVWNGMIQYGVGPSEPQPTSNPTTANPTTASPTTAPTMTANPSAVPTTANPTTANPTTSNPQPGPQLTATFNPTFGAPMCSQVGLSCSSGVLLDGTGGNREPNPSNTLDGCTDGRSGSYHGDESIDKITVTAKDGVQLQEGKVVEVEAKVWAWSSGAYDTADFYYTSSAQNPNWVYIGSFAAGGSQLRTLVAEYTLPVGAPNQAVRVNYRYSGSVSPCGNGRWDDTDDLVFAVADANASGATADISVGTSMKPKPIPAPEPLSSSGCDGTNRIRCKGLNGICRWNGRRGGCSPV